MKSREIFDPEDRPHPKEVRERAESFDSEAALEKSPELRKFLEKIDFSLLETIFLERARKSGVSLEDFNFLGLERIEPFALSGGGEYKAGTNTIGLNASSIARNFREEYPDLDPDLRLLELLSHEESHATAGAECYIDY